MRKTKSRQFANGKLTYLSIDDIRVQSQEPGSAVAVFEKTWRTREGNSGKLTEHQALSRLYLKRIGPSWKITGEQDLIGQPNIASGG